MIEWRSSWFFGRSKAPKSHQLCNLGIHLRLLLYHLPFLNPEIHKSSLQKPIIIANQRRNKKTRRGGSSRRYIYIGTWPSSLSFSPSAAVYVPPLLLAVSGSVRPGLFPVHDQNQLSEFYYAAGYLTTRRFLSEVLPCSEKVPGVFRFFNTSNRSWT